MSEHKSDGVEVKQDQIDGIFEAMVRTNYDFLGDRSQVNIRVLMLRSSLDLLQIGCIAERTRRYYDAYMEGNEATMARLSRPDYQDYLLELQEREWMDDIRNTTEDMRIDEDEYNPSEVGDDEIHVIVPQEEKEERVVTPVPRVVRPVPLRHPTRFTYHGQEVQFYGAPESPLCEDEDAEDTLYRYFGGTPDINDGCGDDGNQATDGEEKKSSDLLDNEDDVPIQKGFDSLTHSLQYIQDPIDRYYVQKTWSEKLKERSEFYVRIVFGILFPSTVVVSCGLWSLGWIWPWFTWQVLLGFYLSMTGMAVGYYTYTKAIWWLLLWKATECVKSYFNYFGLLTDAMKIKLSIASSWFCEKAKKVKDFLLENPILFYLGVAIAIIIIVVMYFNPLKSKKNQKLLEEEKNQSGFLSKYNKAIMQLGFFTLSLTTTGTLTWWKKIQPWLSCMDWLDTINDGSGCQNFPKCQNSDRVGSSYCWRCSRGEAEKQMFDLRSGMGAGSSPHKLFPLFIDDIIHSRSTMWFSSLFLPFRNTVLKFDKTKLDNTYLNKLETREVRIYDIFNNYYVSSMRNVNIALSSTRDNFLHDEIGSGFSFSFVGDRMIFSDPLAITNNLGSDLDESFFRRLWDETPMGIDSILLTKKISLSNDEYCVWWAFPKQPAEVVRESLAARFTSNKFFQAYGTYVVGVVGVMLVLAGLYLHRDKIEKIRQWASDKYEMWWPSEVIGKDESVDDEAYTRGGNSRISRKEQYVQRATSTQDNPGADTTDDDYRRVDYTRRYVDSQKPRQDKSRNRDSNDMTYEAPKNKQFFFYDAHDMYKAIHSSLGMAVFKPGQDPNLTLRYVKDKATWKQLESEGFVPYTAGEKIPHISISRELFDGDRPNYNIAFKYCNWLWRHPSSKIIVSSRVREMVNKLPLPREMKWIPERLDELFKMNQLERIVSMQEQETWKDYLEGTSDIFLDPLFADDSNYWRKGIDADQEHYKMQKKYQHSREEELGLNTPGGMERAKNLYKKLGSKTLNSLNKGEREFMKDYLSLVGEDHEDEKQIAIISSKDKPGQYYSKGLHYARDESIGCACDKLKQTVDESNENEIHTDQCLFEILYGSCTHPERCIRKHKIGVGKDESVIYPERGTIDIRCVVGVYRKPAGLSPVFQATAVATKQGGFLTSKHTFYSEDGGLKFPMSEWFVRDTSCPQYYPIYEMKLPSEQDLKMNNQDYVWDYCRFFISNTSPEIRAFLIRLYEAAPSPSLMKPGLTSDIRVVSWDSVKCLPHEEHGMLDLLIGENMIDYKINTKEGVSGSPVFDQGGRFIGIHKKKGNSKGINTGVYFGKSNLPPFFMSQTLPKNCLALGSQ